MLYITSLVLIYRTTGVCTSQPPLPIPPPLPLPLVTTKLISFSMIFFFLSIWKWSVKMLSHVWLFAAPWSVTLQASLSMRFSRQENWSELPFPSLRDLPGPGIEPGCSALQADCLPSEPGKPRNSEMGCCAPFQEIFPTHGLNPCLSRLPALTDGSFTTSSTWEAPNRVYPSIK